MSTPIPTSNLTGIDPQWLGLTLGEEIALAIQSSVHLLNILLLLYVLKNRHYPPLKIKQIYLVVGAYLCEYPSSITPFFVCVRRLLLFGVWFSKHQPPIFILFFSCLAVEPPQPVLGSTPYSDSVHALMISSFPQMH